MTQTSPFMTWGASKFISIGCLSCQPPELCKECSTQVCYEIAYNGLHLEDFEYSNSRRQTIRIKIAKRFSLFRYRPNKDHSGLLICEGPETYGNLREAIRDHLKEIGCIDRIEWVSECALSPDLPIPAEFSALAISAGPGNNEGHTVRVGVINEAGQMPYQYYDLLIIKILAGFSTALEISYRLGLFIEARPGDIS